MMDIQEAVTNLRLKFTICKGGDVMIPTVILATAVAFNAFLAVFRLSDGAGTAGAFHAALAVFAFCVLLRVVNQ